MQHRLFPSILFCLCVCYVCQCSFPPIHTGNGSLIQALFLPFPPPFLRFFSPLPQFLFFFRFFSLTRTRPARQQIACSYKSLPTSVKAGSKILVADGSLVLTVKECKET